MSAWIVHRRHIDFLVTCLLASDGLVDVRGLGGPDALGQELWQECHDSVNYRYREQTECPDYTYSRLTLPDLGTREGLSYATRAVSSYRYQSCEHPAWESSRAYAWTDALHSALESALEARGGRFTSNRAINGWSVADNYDPAHALATDYVQVDH